MLIQVNGCGGNKLFEFISKKINSPLLEETDLLAIRTIQLNEELKKAGFGQWVITQEQMKEMLKEAERTGDSLILVLPNLCPNSGEMIIKEFL